MNNCEADVVWSTSEKPRMKLVILWADMTQRVVSGYDWSHILDSGKDEKIMNFSFCDHISSYILSEARKNSMRSFN